MLQWEGLGFTDGVCPLRARLPATVARMKRRLEREAEPGRAAELWSATYILMGLCYERAFVQRLLQGVIAMEESVTYQAILEEGEARGEAKGKAAGRAEEARKILLLQGRSRFGAPSADEAGALDAVTDVRKLEELSVRLLQAASWQDLLGPNGTGRRGRGRKKTSLPRPLAGVTLYGGPDDTVHCRSSGPRSARRGPFSRSRMARRSCRKASAVPHPVSPSDRAPGAPGPPCPRSPLRQKDASNRPVRVVLR